MHSFALVASKSSPWWVTSAVKSDRSLNDLRQWALLRANISTAVLNQSMYVGWLQDNLLGDVGLPGAGGSVSNTSAADEDGFWLVLRLSPAHKNFVWLKEIHLISQGRAWPPEDCGAADVLGPSPLLPPYIPPSSSPFFFFYWKANGSLDMVWGNQNSIVKLDFITFS